jgi:hypothetical protein
MTTNAGFEKIIKSSRKQEFIQLDKRKLKVYLSAFGSKYSKKLKKVPANG